MTPPETRRVWQEDGNGPTWREFLVDRGLPWIPRLAVIAEDITHLEQITRYWVETHPDETEAAQTRTDAPHGTIPCRSVQKDGITIPTRLIRDDLRFILVRPGGKGAMEKGWPTVANYPHDHVALAAHTGRGDSYGLFPAAGSRILIIDADNVFRLAELGALDALPDTFTVASGSSTPAHPKAHLYFEIEGEPLTGKRVFYDPETDDQDHLGEVFAQHPTSGKGFVVGPNSISGKTGQPYTIVRDQPIATLTREVWMRFANAVRWQKERPRTEPNPRVAVPRGDSFASLLGLTVEQVWPVPSDAEESGEWMRFSHPVHGSANGNNLAIHRHSGVWHCFRCGSSGDALIALAVDAGIITCEDARPGCLASKETMERVKDEARNRGLPVDDAERRAHIAYLKARQPMPYEAQDIKRIRAEIAASIRAAGARVEAE